jgi:Fe-S cluster assembly protein SufD
VQRWDDDAVHLAAHQARVDRDASLTHVVVSLGGGIVR